MAVCCDVAVGSVDPARPGFLDDEGGTGFSFIESARAIWSSSSSLCRSTSVIWRFVGFDGGCKLGSVYVSGEARTNAEFRRQAYFESSISYMLVP